MSADPLVGKQLGDYTILGLLGRGGMSRVYQGYDENLDRYAAVKVISSDFATTTEEEYTRRFQIEARAIARLRHPNIVGVYQFGRSEGIYYMAMVFLEGQDLRSYLNGFVERRVLLPVPEILRIARDIAGALDYAHEQGVIHRDIKPSNIMLEKHTGRAILMDFGLALSVHEGTTGDTFGSAHYIAPEQAVSSAQAVAQSDLYSLGIVLYEMLAGKVPFDDPSAMSVALKHLNEAPPPMSLYNPKLPPEVEAVIMRALEKKPEHRYPTGRELVDALERALHRSGYGNNAPLSAVPPFMPSTDTEPTPWFGQRPNLTPDPSETNPTPEPGALAQRFARYKARKEEETVGNLSEDQLALDDGTLNSILDSYADPRELGLVGPGAEPFHPAHAEEDDLRASIATAPRARRRLRIGVLLLSILLLAGALITAWYMGGPGKDDTVEGGSPAAVAILSTADLTDEAEPTMRPSVTRTSAQSTGTVAATSTTTGAAVVTVEPSESPVPTQTETQPRATTSPAPSDTTEPTKSSTPTTAPSDTASPSLTPTRALPAGTVSDPALQLVYDEDELLLVNISGQPQDISQLVFTQTVNDGTVYNFQANLWRASSANLISMPNGSCYQVVRAEVTRAEPDSSLCPRFLGWYQPGMELRYFWIAEQPNASFIVHYAGDDTPLATCDIAAGECFVALPED
ncbi:MAG TPA: protein kinase [Aggregatilinea sp.]|uniref:protein kinase domain-containing protein n=1 Tax=Aggregatilinea sp. TaxID=2806333 RepID=UPI002D1346F3|nr:protein kinase [Aggregatilinea sp.]HML21576.1 protein kinase [Aggregatilinea sp.]